MISGSGASSCDLGFQIGCEPLDAARPPRAQVGRRPAMGRHCQGPVVVPWRRRVGGTAGGARPPDATARRSLWRSALASPLVMRDARERRPVADGQGELPGTGRRARRAVPAARAGAGRARCCCARRRSGRPPGQRNSPWLTSSTAPRANRLRGALGGGLAARAGATRSAPRLRRRRACAGGGRRNGGPPGRRRWAGRFR